MISKLHYQSLLDYLKIPNAELLGKGMEGMVFEFSTDRVVKIWFRGNESRLNDRKRLYEKVRNQLQVPISEIFEIGTFNGLSYTIEKKLLGKPGHIVYLSSNKKVQKKLLDNYFNLLAELKSTYIQDAYGQLISDSSELLQTKNWSAYIEKKLEKALKKATLKPDHDIENVKQLFEKFFKEDLPHLKDTVPKNVVHGDLFLENIMANEQGQITGLLDFGSLSVIGDHLIDVATLSHAITISEGIDEEAEKYLLDKTIKNYQSDMKTIRIYVLYYCLFFINSLKNDPRTYKWCITKLKLFGYLE